MTWRVRRSSPLWHRLLWHRLRERAEQVHKKRGWRQYAQGGQA